MVFKPQLIADNMKYLNSTCLHFEFNIKCIQITKQLYRDMFYINLKRYGNCCDTIYILHSLLMLVCVHLILLTINYVKNVL